MLAFLAVCGIWIGAGLVLLGIPLNLMSVGAVFPLFVVASIAGLMRERIHPCDVTRAGDPTPQAMADPEGAARLGVFTLFLSTVPFVFLGQTGLSALAQTVALGFLAVFLVSTLWKAKI
jgi:hypothetical protein